MNECLDLMMMNDSSRGYPAAADLMEDLSTNQLQGLRVSDWMGSERLLGTMSDNTIYLPIDLVANFLGKTEQMSAVIGDCCWCDVC